MEEGGVQQNSYITWLFHHLVAVLCNDANGEKERGRKFISKSGRSQVSCFCRGSQCTSLLVQYERRSVCFTPKLAVQLQARSWFAVVKLPEDV